MEKKKVGDITKTLRYGQTPSSSSKLKKIINTPTYTTNGEYLLIVKDVDSCVITLDNSTTESVKIKVLTKSNIVVNDSLIDNQYDEIEIENGACIELECFDGNWYIISSDGMKLE